MKTTENALAIFAKFPEPGKVKTRLAKTMGFDAACDLYASFLRNLVENHHRQTYDLVLAFDPVEKEAEFREFFSFAQENIFFYPQRGGDLGERLFDCFKNLLKSYKKVTIIGSDIPDLEGVLIQKAFQELSDAHVVLGPSEDGGYYLIAMKQPHDIFHHILWSTDSVLKQQLENIHKRQLKISFLEKRYDIDTWKDLHRLKTELSGRFGNTYD